MQVFQLQREGHSMANQGISDGEISCCPFASNELSSFHKAVNCYQNKSQSELISLLTHKLLKHIFPVRKQQTVELLAWNSGGPI